MLASSSWTSTPYYALSGGVAISTRKQRRNARRAEVGDGSRLPRYRWWQLLNRSLFELELPVVGGGRRYAVDVRLWGDGSDGEVRARLYRDGSLAAVSKVPTVFPVEGGEIDVAATTVGMKRCHFVPDHGPEQVLVPHPSSAEGRRARFDREHPAASRVVGAVALMAVLVGAALALAQVVAQLTAVPPVAESIGAVEWPLRIPVAVNVGVGVIAVLGVLDRAMRLRTSWIDSLAT